VQADMSGDPPPQALSEADAIVSFGPMDGLAAWLALQERVVARGLVATSSMSASKRDSPVEADRALSARLRAGEAAVIAQCERLGIAWTILRPTMIYGAGLDRNLTPVARMARRTRVLPMPQASGLRQPVHAEDVALAAIAAVRDGAAAGRIVEIGGGERACRTLRCSSVCAKAWAAGSCRCPAWPCAAAALLPPMRGPLGRLEADLVADNTVLNSLLDVAPRPFHPDADTWRLRTWPEAT
jgi:nucleoside-diphosphate-sugar epimerase